MIVMPTQREAVEFTGIILKEGVILRYVDAFGLPDCIRITVGTGQELEHFEESFEQCVLTN